MGARHCPDGGSGGTPLPRRRSEPVDGRGIARQIRPFGLKSGWNDGALPDLPDSAVVEIPARIDRDGAHPVALEPLAPKMRGLVQAAKDYEELAVGAAISGDRRAALRAIVANPLVGWEAAEPLLEALLEANRPYLPRFFA